MASESLRMIISADDQASQKFAQVAANAEQSVRRIKDTTKATKSTAEFAGTLANVLGGSELSQYAGQIGQISEKISQFSEVSKSGGAGAFAFKAGLVAMVGALAFQVGNAIGNAIAQTEKYTDQLNKAAARSKEVFDLTQQRQQQLFTENKQDIELIRDPDAKKQAYKELFETTKANIIGVESQIKGSITQLDEATNRWTVWRGERTADMAKAKEQLDQDKARLKLLNEQAAELEQILGPRAEEIEAIKKKNAELDKEEQYIASLEKQVDLLRAKNSSVEEFNKLTAQGNTATEEGQQKAEKLLAQIDEQNKLAEEKKKAEDIAKKAAEDEIKRIENLDQMRQKELQALELRRIALEQGAEAAKKAALIQQGLSEDVASEIAAKEALLAADEKAAQDKQKAQEEEQRRLDRIQESREKILQDLEKQKILIEQGEEAARSFALQQEGFAKDEADRIAAEEARLDKLKKQKEDSLKATQAGAIGGPIEARESRLLSGRGAAAENMSKKQLQALVDIQNAIVNQTKNNRVKLVQTIK